MKRTLSVVIFGSVLLAMIAESGTAAATRHSGPTSITLHLRSQVQHATYVDNPPPGPSAGDDLVFTERLLNLTGHTVGSDAASCIVLFDKRSLCTGAYILHSGQIMVQLVQPGPTGTYTQAITGGTGAYARATGTVTAAQSPSAGDRFTFHVTLPGS
jgi:hypothetical protein